MVLLLTLHCISSTSKGRATTARHWMKIVALALRSAIVLQETRQGNVAQATIQVGHEFTPLKEEEQSVQEQQIAKPIL